MSSSFLRSFTLNNTDKKRIQTDPFSVNNYPDFVQPLLPRLFVFPLPERNGSGMFYEALSAIELDS